MIASLPMYDMPDTQAANDRLWTAIRAAYGRGPENLDRTTDPHDTWLSPDLVLSQTCGLPYRSGLHRHVRLVGTPDYGVDGCAPGYYRSCIVVRRDDPADDPRSCSGMRLGRNDIRSQSGWAAFVAHMRSRVAGFAEPAAIVDTGSQAASIRAVAERRADIAAIDAVTWALLSRHDPWTRQLRVLCRTDPTPGLPLITAPTEDATALFDAIERAIAGLSQADRDCLHLRGIVALSHAAYMSVPLP